jgi:hypothetical protein
MNEPCCSLLVLSEAVEAVEPVVACDCLLVFRVFSVCLLKIDGFLNLSIFKPGDLGTASRLVDSIRLLAFLRSQYDAKFEITESWVSQVLGRAGLVGGIGHDGTMAGVDFISSMFILFFC